MPFSSFSKSGNEQHPSLSIGTTLPKAISEEPMGPGSPSNTGDHSSARFGEQSSPPQILVIGSENFSKNLVEYALKMGQRLDCRIIAVNTTTLPFSITEEQQERVKEIFFINATKAGAKFSELAASIGVSFIHLMEIGEETQIIRDIAARYTGIRYVLTEPELKDTDDPDSAQIPVFDLASTRI